MQTHLLKKSTKKGSRIVTCFVNTITVRKFQPNTNSSAILLDIVKTSISELVTYLKSKKNNLLVFFLFQKPKNKNNF